MRVRVGVVSETAAGERRVALVPDDVKALVGEGFEIAAERGAGSRAGIQDGAYRTAGAEIVGAGQDLTADLLVSVRGPKQHGAALSRVGAAHAFIGVFDPLWRPDRARALADTGATGFSLDLVPRITRAQSMDVLSSMGVIAGYEAVLLAASKLPQMFPLMMTAAGTIAPARVLVLGAGVAGLQAIATARRLGAVVKGYDVRPAALEQIRSMGARAVEIDLSGADEDFSSDEAEGSDGYARAQSEHIAARQRELLTEHVAASEVVLATAAIPGRASPLLVTAPMVDEMEAGSVLVDLAVERGGNCELTRADAEVIRGGVTVLGPTDLVSRCARHASQMFSRNLSEFLRHIAPGGEFAIDAEDEITAAMLVTRGGDIINPAVAAAEAAAKTSDAG